MNIEIFTPELLTKNRSTSIEYGFHTTSRGETILALFQDKICHFVFRDTEKKEALKALAAYWPEFTLIRNQQKTAPIMNQLFSANYTKTIAAHPLLLRGTPFQCAVWRAAAEIPTGKTVSYQTIAEMINAPRAMRAVGTALGKNKIAYFIPCHRIVRKDGSLGEYRWGKEHKQALLDIEQKIKKP